MEGRIVKRLSFETVSGALLPAGQIAAGGHPEVNSLQRELKELVASAEAQWSGVWDAVQQQHVSGSDLKRLKRRFQTLKNTYVNYDVKERFIEGLDQGESDADKQGVVLAQMEDLLEQNSEQLKEAKQLNEQVRSNIVETISKICVLHDKFTHTCTNCNTLVDRMKGEYGEHESNRPPLPSPASPGLTIEECEAAIQQEVERARTLEASMAATQSENLELEASCAATRHELQCMRGEVEQLQALSEDRAKAKSVEQHYLHAAEWCEEMTKTLAALSGVSIVYIDEDAIHVQLTITVPTTTRGQGQPELLPLTEDKDAVRRCHHELSIYLIQGTTQVKEAELRPTVVDITPISSAAKQCRPDGHCNSLQFLVREVRASLYQHWARQAIIDRVSQTYPIRVVSPHEPLVLAALPHQVEAEVVVPWSWPQDSSQHLTLKGLSTMGSSPELKEAIQQADNSTVLEHQDLMELLKGVASRIEQCFMA